MKVIHFNVGDVLLLKKEHPCGSKQFKVIRSGSDVKICCLGCNRNIMLPREKIEKMVQNPN